MAEFPPELSLSLQKIEGVEPTLTRDVYEKCLVIPDHAREYTFLGTQHRFQCSTDGVIFIIEAYADRDEPVIALRLESHESGNITLFEETEGNATSARDVDLLLQEFLNSELSKNVKPFPFDDGDPAFDQLGPGTAPGPESLLAGVRERIGRSTGNNDEDQ
ncbi:hypothetical protein IPJ72_04345 [Candidatus Peregrinibacteria bacterium]|nr:MAG: hypothetical protein IPJ72_04345 [Candidatus Peregrinibacteria bacterium]